MTRFSKTLGLAPLDGISAKSNAKPGAIVRSGLAVAGIAIAIAALTALGAGSAAAADTFTGCLTKNGKLKNVALGDEPRRRCRGKSTEISWSVEGPKGDTGDPGPQGPAGPIADSSDILEQLDNLFQITTGC